MKNNYLVRIFCIASLSLAQVACVPQPLDKNAVCSVCNGAGQIYHEEVTRYSNGYTHREKVSTICGSCGGSGNSSHFINRELPMIGNQIIFTLIKSAFTR